MTQSAPTDPASQSTDERLGGKAMGGGKGFFLIWVGQVVSLVGTGLSRFGLGVWVFELTGSISQYTLIIFTGSLPGLFIAPIAGTLADRWDRRTLLIVSDTLSGAAILVIAALHGGGGLEIWHVYVYMAFTSVLDSFQIPAFLATASLMVPKEGLGRAAGMLQMGPALGGILAPISAGYLMVSVGLNGVVVLDLLTFLVAVGTLLMVRIPRPAMAAALRRESFREEMLLGWRFLWERPALLALLAFFALTNFALSLVLVLLPPMVLSFSDASVLGVVSTVSSLGFLVGGLVMSLQEGPRRRMYLVLCGGFLQGAGMVVVGLRPQAALIALGLFAISVSAAITNASSQAIWQAKVPPALQGRVFAVRRMLAQIAQPLGELIAGPLAEKVFQPLLLPGGLLFLSLGSWFGTGPERGIALIYITFAALPVLFSAVGFLVPRLRNLDDEVPDALPEEGPTPG